MRIEGQAVIVTGGGSGLGEATARARVVAGAKVAMLDFNLAATAAHGPARILVSCAGIAPGLFETAMLPGLPQAAQDSLGASVSSPRGSAGRRNTPTRRRAAHGAEVSPDRDGEIHPFPFDDLPHE